MRVARWAAGPGAPGHCSGNCDLHGDGRKQTSLGDCRDTIKEDDQMTGPGELKSARQDSTFRIKKKKGKEPHGLF